MVPFRNSGHGSPAGGMTGSLLPAGAGMPTTGGGIPGAGGFIVGAGGGGTMPGPIGFGFAGAGFPGAGGTGLAAGGGGVWIGTGCIGREIGGGVPTDVGEPPAAPRPGAGPDTGSRDPDPGGLATSEPQPQASTIPAANKLARTMLITTTSTVSGKRGCATQVGLCPFP